MHSSLTVSNVIDYLKITEYYNYPVQQINPDDVIDYLKITEYYN